MGSRNAQDGMRNRHVFVALSCDGLKALKHSSSETGWGSERVECETWSNRKLIHCWWCFCSSHDYKFNHASCYYHDTNRNNNYTGYDDSVLVGLSVALQK